MKTGFSVARVVLESRLPQLDRLFDYSIPPELSVTPGMRVKVPLRSENRSATGFVVEVAKGSEHKGALSAITEVVSPVTLLPPELYELARLVADRQAGSVADVLRLAIPQRYVRQEKQWLATPPTPPETLGEPQPLAGFPDASLVEALEPGARVVVTPPGGVVVGGNGQPRPRSTDFVAGLAHRVLARRKSVVVVVPDWRDLEHQHQALLEVIPGDAVILSHGEMPGAARYQSYLRGLSDEPAVVLGSRHAVYHPVANLGLMVVVEDGDDAHREPLAPYPNTRDVALLRAQYSEAALVFSSAVPSLATTRWLGMGYFTSLRSTEHTRPTVIPTALTLAVDEGFSPARLPPQAHQAAKEALSNGPVLVQVFRSGYSTGLACNDCGERGGCSRCQGPLGLAGSNKVPVCQWCGHTETPWQCQACAGRSIVPRGQGIGRTVSDLGKAFPKVPVIRSDGSNRVLAVDGSPALIVATRGAEPVCPGGYQVALLLDGVAMLSRESLSTLEDTVRAWESAISLVAPSGKVFVTEVEGSPALGVASGSYHTLLAQELAAREATRLPPALRLASVSGPARVVAEIREKIVSLDSSIDALGPVPLGDGNTRSILRFPYTLGNKVTSELRAAHLIQIGKQGRHKTLRVRIVVDDPGQLDALVAE